MRNLSRDLSADEQEAPRLIEQLAADLADCVLRAGAILAGMVVSVLQDPSVPTLSTSRPDVKSESAALTVREAAGMLGVSIPGMRLRIARRETAVVLPWTNHPHSKDRNRKDCSPKIWSRREGDSDISEAQEPESTG